MASIERRIAICYKIPRATSFIAKDIIIMKKINFVLQKLEKTGEDIYILETFNLLKTLANIFDLPKLYLVLCEFTNFEYHSTLAFLIEQTETFEKDQAFNIIKKLQELAEDY